MWKLYTLLSLLLLLLLLLLLSLLLLSLLLLVVVVVLLLFYSGTLESVSQVNKRSGMCLLMLQLGQILCLIVTVLRKI